MKVRRVETAHGSYIVPPIEDRWSELTKLRWPPGREPYKPYSLGEAHLRRSGTVLDLGTTAL